MSKNLINENQAKQFAIHIYRDIQNYIKENHDEYERWLTEQDEKAQQKICNLK